MTTLTWTILGLPLFTALIIAVFLNARPKIAGTLATASMMANFIAVLFLFNGANHHPFESSIVWIPLQGFGIELGVLVNGLSLLMLLIVTGIGSLIFLYSTSYMEHEEGQSRYFASLSFFAFSMLGIVLSNNFIQIFIFWELVGLASYLLIGFFFHKPEASTAGKKAFMTTRVGDVGMMIGILLLFGFLANAGTPTFNFAEIEKYMGQAAIPQGMMTLIALGLFMGVAGKSAQVPLHVWLPDAMEGPTPVSALIHAATMVAAGVFLLVRVDFVFEAAPVALSTIAWIGGITALLAGTIAVVQNDIKKILAYSTLSQLGYMVMAIGLGNAEAGMFHLTTHAFFKALLFLGAGSLIHSLHTQEIWKMPTDKGLLKSMPITTTTFLIGTFALMGLPPLSGYFSKEEVLATASHGPAPLFWIALAVVFLTAFYMGRLCTIVFFRTSKTKEVRPMGLTPQESGWPISLPLILLAILSVIGGYLPIRDLVSHGHHGAHHESALFLAALSIGLALAGFISAFFLFRKQTEACQSQAFPKVLLEKKYFFDEFYDGVVIKGFQENIARISDWFERIVVIEGGVNGTARLTRLAGDWLRKLQSGVVQFYALVFSVGMTTLIYLFVWMGLS